MGAMGLTQLAYHARGAQRSVAINEPLAATAFISMRHPRLIVHSSSSFSSSDTAIKAD
jgi:hypothetical protein